MVNFNKIQKTSEAKYNVEFGCLYVNQASTPEPNSQNYFKELSELFKSNKSVKEIFEQLEPSAEVDDKKIEIASRIGSSPFLEEGAETFIVSEPVAATINLPLKVHDSKTKEYSIKEMDVST